MLSPPVTSPKQMAPPRPMPSAAASQQLSAGVHIQQSAVTPSCTSTQPRSMMSVPPSADNNNVIYSNCNDINDWTDDEWDDDDDDEDEDIRVSKIWSIIFESLFLITVI